MLPSGWPPKTSGYVDTHEDVQNGSLSHVFPGQTAIEVIAEVKARLEKTKEAGATLVWELQGIGFDDVDLRWYWKFKNYLSPGARDALNYMAGVKRRKVSFTRWKWFKAAKPWRK